jgi:3'-5' exoribonuclease
VLAHHGRVEYGSPKTPLTLEALLTHTIDELDSRVNSWLNLMGREGGSKRWTTSDNVYEQPIWRGALPTAQVEKKGPAPELLTPVIYVPRGPGGGERPQAQRKPKEKRRPEPRTGAGEAKPGEAPASGAAAGAHEARAEAPARAEERPPRPPRAERPERGGREQRGFGGGFGDKKRGYTGPRLPGDTGPRRAPEKKEKALTHNPFAALAAKLEGAGKGEEKPEAAEAAPPQPEATEATAPQAEAAPPAPAEAAPEPAAAPAPEGSAAEPKAE